MKTRVLGTLIEQLQDGDWDTGDESLAEFADDPAIVAAFAANGVHLDEDAAAAGRLAAVIAAAQNAADDLAEQIADTQDPAALALLRAAMQRVLAIRNAATA